MYRDKLIPHEAVAKWDELGIELGFSDGELNVIAGDAAQKAVERCSQEMLKMWQITAKDAATADELIKALEAVELNSYIAQLRNG